jgi:hypothetical protein
MRISCGPALAASAVCSGYTTRHQFALGRLAQEDSLALFRHSRVSVDMNGTALDEGECNLDGKWSAPRARSPNGPMAWIEETPRRIHESTVTSPVSRRGLA